MANNIEQNYLIDLYHSGDFEKTAGGDLLTVEGLENLRQAIFHRLSTTQGSLAHRPLYGVGIQQYQGSFSSLSTQRQLALKIKEQLEEDQRIDEVKGIQIRQDEDDPAQYYVIVRIVPVGYNETTEEFAI